MFTGLIEDVGEALEVKPTAAGVRLRIAAALADDLAPGASLAINGVCLTVLSARGGEVHADVGPETLRVTTLGLLRPGGLVNLERPLRADSRLGGHFVQGHVDEVGTVDEIRVEGEFRWLTISYPPVLRPYIVHKGAIAVDGISLTVAGLGDNRFDVQIVPFTWEHTNLRGVRPVDRVNLECDILGKYVVRAVEQMGPGRPAGSRTH